MKKVFMKNRYSMIVGAIAALGCFYSASALAQQFIVFNDYQEIPEKSAQLSDVLKNDIMQKLAGVQGLQLAKFYYNPADSSHGSVFVWKSEKDWDAYLKSDLRKSLVSKLTPYIKGEVRSRGFPVLDK